MSAVNPVQPSQYLIVAPDAATPGIPDATPLKRFLDVFEPGRARIVTTAELLAGPPVRTEHLFIGLPTPFGPQHMARVQARRIALFDYFDGLPPAWHDSDEAYLRTLTPLYLKTTLMQGIDFSLTMGLLPMALPVRIGRALRLRRWLAPLQAGLSRLLGRDDRPWELSLLGTATFLDETDAEGRSRRYHQRVEWLREVRQRPKWQFWGGLYPLPNFTIAQIEADCGPVRELFGQAQRLERNRFLARMGQTKVALCPAGHARWTYRHLEAVYCGCEVVSSDLTGIRTLPRLPTEHMDMVPDHAPVTPYVERALAERAGRAGRRRAALDVLERQLDGGMYAHSRREVFEKFSAQLER
jgi:hypothetical protein